MVKQRLTEKRMANRRFRKTEEAILEVIRNEDYYIGIDSMTKKAGIARSTFYHHHRTVRHVLPDYERYMMRKYARMINRLMRNKKVRVRAMYMNMLIFMMQNKKIFGVFMQHDKTMIINEMIVRMKDKLMKNMRIPEGAEKVFTVYCGEISALIYEWANKGMDVNRVEEILDDIMYLTNTAKGRLLPIREN